jgi:CRISPR-associated protein Cas2
LVDPVQFKQLKTRLVKVIDEERDSLRFYLLGSKWKRKVEHIGAKPGYDPEGLLFIE